MVVDGAGVEGDHVVVLKLKPSQKLSEIVAGQHCQHNFTKAVVIVNSTESLALESAYLEGYVGSKYPLLIVSCSDGQKILSLMEKERGKGHLMCDIQAESGVDRLSLPPLRQPQDVTRAKTASSGSRYFVKFIFDCVCSLAFILED